MGGRGRREGGEGGREGRGGRMEGRERISYSYITLAQSPCKLLIQNQIIELTAQLKHSL